MSIPRLIIRGCLYTYDHIIMLLVRILTCCCFWMQNMHDRQLMSYWFGLWSFVIHNFGISSSNNSPRVVHTCAIGTSVFMDYAIGVVHRYQRGEQRKQSLHYFYGSRNRVYWCLYDYICAEHYYYYSRLLEHTLCGTALDMLLFYSW